MENEISEKMRKDIQTFRDNSASRFKNKNFVILYHNTCDLANLAPNTKIYVLGHGIDCYPDRKLSSTLDNPNLPYEELKHLPFHDWAYTVSGGKKAITIDEISKRMIADGLTKTDSITIKLWFCDPSNKAYIIARRFVEGFANYSNSLRVDYYENKILYSPTIRDGEMHKWARDEKTGQVVRASSIRASLFSKNHSDENETNMQACNEQVEETRYIV
ncbi:hypothetical protein [Legionella sp. PC1000]|nr:hypothetical protein [Legionella sp. PC1000]